MVAITLTDNLIKKGEVLLKELDKQEIKVDAVLWFYHSDVGFWKLLLSLPNHEDKGSKAIYIKIQKILSKFKEEDKLSLDDITTVKSQAPVLELLRIAVKTGDGINGIRFSNNVINGQLISDAYIYRLI